VDEICEDVVWGEKEIRPVKPGRSILRKQPDNVNGSRLAEVGLQDEWRKRQERSDVTSGDENERGIERLLKQGEERKRGVQNDVKQTEVKEVERTRERESTKETELKTVENVREQTDEGAEKESSVRVAHIQETGQSEKKSKKEEAKDNTVQIEETKRKRECICGRKENLINQEIESSNKAVKRMRNNQRKKDLTQWLKERVRMESTKGSNSSKREKVYF
jgi:hypothetical protein